MNIIKVNNSCEIHTIDDLKVYYEQVKPKIRERLADFDKIGKEGSKFDLFRELVFCILTANASAKMGLKSINALDSTIFDGTAKDIERRLRGIYRYPASRANYIIRSRDFLQSHCDLDLQIIFRQYEDQFQLREFLAKHIIGIAFKECSHFLRNIGYKGFAILDKHIISMFNLIGCAVRKPKNKREYRELELKMIAFAERNQLDIDDLDLVFWSYRTGEIIK